MFRESRDFGPRGKESWWWNESVKSKVIVEKNCVNNCLGVKMLKLGKSIRKLGTRPRRQ